MKSILLTLLTVFTYSLSFPQIKSLKDFGAKGDGVTNDYNALLKASAYFNKIGTGTLIIPEGRYFIGSVKGKDNKIKDIEFRNLSDFNVIGQNSKIIVNATFKRATDYKKNKFYYSYTNAVSPFKFFNSSGINISGLEIDGGAKKASKDNVIEGWSFLLYFEDCVRVSLKNLYLHHALTDGLYIKGTKSTYFKASGVVCDFNARQGMSIVALRNGEFSNCTFSNTGQATNYGYHKPAAGVDIETGTLINAVTNIVFNKCKFKNNVGSQIVITNPKGVNGVTISDSEITAQNGNSKYVIISGGKNILIKNCTIDANLGAVYCNWKSTPGTSVKIMDNTIKSKAQGILAEGGSNDLIQISGNSLLFYGSQVLKTYFPYLKNRNVSFLNNEVIIPKSLQNDSRWYSLIQFASVVDGNIFTDDAGKSFLNKVSFHNSKTNSNK